MVEIDRRSPVVCDAGPLIHLDELDSLDLLRDFGSVLIPDLVWQEVEHHRPSALAVPPPWFQRAWLRPGENGRPE